MSSALRKEFDEARFEGFRNLVTELGQEISHLASEDFATVTHNISSLVEKQVKDKPFQALASAAGLGFVLGGLKASQIKFAAIHLGKLLAVKTMSRIEENTRLQALASGPQTPSPTQAQDQAQEKKNAG
jgi:ElaB/YqjD/DUF883 family membrane-anchored ribosome-binding protein